jgi:Putative Ig domain
MTVGFGRAVLVVGVVCSGLLIGACGVDSSGSASTDASAQAGVITRSSQTTITGVPAPAATVGQTYSFQPQATAPSGSTARFAITNKPSWASFNTATGELSGTPSSSQMGQYAGITIKLTAGTQSATLAPFSITVESATAVAAVTLSWQAPTENSDGSPLVDLKGYKVFYGLASKSYTGSVDLPNPGLTMYVVQNLAMGTYYFAIGAYNAAGQLSSMSGEVSAFVN